MALLHRLKALVIPLLLLAVLVAPGPARGQTQAPSSWKEIDQLINQQKFEAAAKATEARLNQARAQGNEDEWTRALIRLVQARTGLHGYETTVRFLREQINELGLEEER